jgi:hypothetical protein
MPNDTLGECQVLTAASIKVTVFWIFAPYSRVEVALVMEASSASETSVNLYRSTRRIIPEVISTYCALSSDMIVTIADFDLVIWSPVFGRTSLQAQRVVSVVWLPLALALPQRCTARLSGMCCHRYNGPRNFLVSLKQNLYSLKPVLLDAG